MAGQVASRQPDGAVPPSFTSARQARAASFGPACVSSIVARIEHVLNMNDLLVIGLAGVACCMFGIFPHAHVASDSERQRWERIRALGRGRFVLSCVLRQGLWFGAVFFGAGFLLASLLAFSLAWTTSQFVELAILSLVLMLAAGSHYASRTWRESEKDYQNLFAKNHVG
jgi:hypothetical protein